MGFCHSGGIAIVQWFSKLNSAAIPPRCHRDKGGETAERSSAVALNGVDSLSLPNLVLFSSFNWVLDVWVFFMFVFESHVSNMCLFR